MRLSTMVGRVALVQTLVTVVALGVVVLMTGVSVTLLLARQTDRALDDLLTRTMAYLEAASEAKSIDWEWLGGEINESRPLQVRFELREKLSRRTVIALGSGPAIGAVELGCHDRDAFRVCAKSNTRFTAVAQRDNALDLALRDQLILALAVACAVSGLSVALLSVAVTRRAIRPLSELAARVATVEPGSGQRVQPTATLQELEVVERRFADLIARFDEALLRERQFTAHASHELRTPLTLARAEVERLSHSTSALAALTRLESLIQRLLWFARTQEKLNLAELDVVNLADVVGEQLGALRNQHRSLVITESLPDEALVRGDEHLLRSATQNLLDNAVKHSRGSAIGVSLMRETDQLVLHVTNGGPVIPQSLGEQIFIPFVRGDAETAGFGLGLPFARAVARAHEGDVTLAADGGVSTHVLLRLPLIAWHTASARLDSVQNEPGA